MLQKKDVIQLYITGVLIVVLIFLVIRGCNTVRRKKNLLIKAAALHSDAMSYQKRTQSDLFAQLVKETEELEITRDPFFKPQIKAAQGPKLNGIAWDQERPTAIINTKIVEVGDKVDGYIVTEIKEESVVLNDGDRSLILSIE